VYRNHQRKIEKGLSIIHQFKLIYHLSHFLFPHSASNRLN
jgi:hypothetical protein